MALSTGDSKSPGSAVDIAQLAASQIIFRKGLSALWLVGAALSALGVLQADTHAFLSGAALFVLTPIFLRMLAAGQPRAAVTAALSLLLGLGCTLLITGGGIHDVALVIFPAVSVLSALLLERRVAALFAVLVPLCVAVVGLAELSGSLKTGFSHAVSPLDVAILVLVLSAIGWFTQNLARTLYQSFEQDYYREQTYREIFNASNEVIVIHDAHTGDVVDVNERALALTGFTREEVLKFSLADFTRADGAYDLNVAMSFLKKAREEGPQVFEWSMGGKDGSTRPTEISLRAARILGQDRVIAIVRDIGERKLVAARLLASERLQAVGQLAGGVAHDFNNQLTAIITNASLLRRRLEGDSYAVARLDAILGCSNRSADLTRQLLAFARKSQATKVSVDMGQLAGEVLSLLEHSVDKRIELSGAERAERTWVMGDPSLLQSALLNLGLNARDAMPDGGRLTLSTCLMPAEAIPADVRHSLGDVAPSYVRTTVVDNGEGMEPAVAEHIFEPFFTTKRQGVGMGLSAVYGTVESHRGAIAVHSALREGTRVEIYLPATDEPPAHSAASAATDALPALHLLLAEDDEQVAKSTREILESFGCRVTHRGDGLAALEAFEVAPASYDVVLLDHAMPKMTGRDLAARVRSIRPDMPIIATSGYGDAFHGAERQADCVFLPKPFDMAALRDAVDAATRRT